jgi:DNA-binding CsgD family transcriptional regulator
MMAAEAAVICRHGWDVAGRGQPCPACADCAAHPQRRHEEPRGTLTARQAEVLSWLVEQAAANLAMPTIRELATHLGISINATFDHVRALRRKGYLWERSRRLRLTARALREPAELAALRAENEQLRARGAQLEAQLDRTREES